MQTLTVVISVWFMWGGGGHLARCIMVTCLFHKDFTMNPIQWIPRIRWKNYGKTWFTFYSAATSRWIDNKEWKHLRTQCSARKSLSLTSTAAGGDLQGLMSKTINTSLSPNQCQAGASMYLNCRKSWCDTGSSYEFLVEERWW